MMRKFIAVLAVFSILALGFVGALATLPHSHGGDFSHSKHETCPVYQFGLHGHDAWAGISAGFSFVSALLFFILLRELFFFRQNLFSSSLLRAPPVSL